MSIHERKEREKEHRKEEILDAAQKIFFEKGLLISTMDEIAEAAELSKGTLYLYYKSKEDLYLAVMMRGLQVLYEMAEHVVNSFNSILEKLIELVDVYRKFFESNKNFFRMFYFMQAPQFHKQVSDEMWQSCSVINQKLWNLVVELLKKGIEEGLLRSDLNPVEIAIIFWSSSTALMLRMDGEGERWSNKMNIDLLHTLETSNDLLIEAILTEAGRAQLVIVTNDRNWK